MSLNSISLSSRLIADLYHHSLVSGTATAMPQKVPVPSLGKGGKNILVVVNQAAAPFLPDGELAFFTKVLTACQLGLLDVAIVNWHKAPHQDAEAMITQFGATSVILFNVEAAPFNLPSGLPYFTVHDDGNRRYLSAPALAQIEQSQETKGQLWVALKQLFGL